MQAFVKCLLIISILLISCRIDNKTVINDDSEKFVHFSIDDCSAVFKDITENENEYDYLFEQSFFKYLRSLHKKYDAKVTLYCFYDFNNFCIKNCTTKFKKDFEENSDWLKIGYHAYDVNHIFDGGGGVL